MGDGKLPEQCDSESISINNVGTLDAIDVNLLDDFDYVALGHIHRPQKIKRDTVRYSGTPLKYSFSEVNDKKSVVIIDTDNIDNIELIELKPLRNMQVLKGTYEEVMNNVMPAIEKMTEKTTQKVIDLIKVEGMKM